MSKSTNPVKAIREKCLDCCCGSSYEVERCTAVNCPLHEWRFGKNPYRKPPTEAQKEAGRIAGQKAAARMRQNCPSDDLSKD